MSIFSPLGLGLGIASSLFGGGGDGGGGDQTQTVINEPWGPLQEFLVGNFNHTPQMNNPLNSDWLWWNYMMGQGYMVGPPPPMMVDDPRYTGENVYDPPFQFQPHRQNVAFGDNGPHGAGVPNTGIDPNQGYPSGNPNNPNLTPATPQPAAPAAPEGSQGLSAADLYNMRQWEANLFNNDPDGGQIGPQNLYQLHRGVQNGSFDLSGRHGQTLPKLSDKGQEFVEDSDLAALRKALGL